MSFKEIMLILAQEWAIGYAVSMSVCVILYLVCSILMIRSCRKVGYDIGVSGMIPIWNITVIPIKRIKSAKNNRIIEVDEEIIL